MLDYGTEARSAVESLLGSVFFVSNVYFHATSGYSSPRAESAPLLHTSSLSGKVQVYLLFPVLLIARSTSFPHAWAAERVAP